MLVYYFHGIGAGSVAQHTGWPRTFLAIAEHCYGDREVAFPSTNRLMDITGLNRASIKRARKELVNVGLLKVHYRKNEKGSNDANLYEIHKPWTHAARSVENSDKLSTRGSPMSPGGGSPMSPKEEKLKEVTVTQSSDIPIQDTDTVPAPAPPKDASELIGALAGKASMRNPRSPRRAA